MIRSLQQQAFGLQHHSLRILPQTIIPATCRFASLSAIHRGLRGSEKAQYGEAKERTARIRLPADRGNARGKTRRRKDDDDIQTLTAKALEGAGSKRKQAKLMSKLKKKQDEIDGTGRKTRRKRFNDPDLHFGKKSLVYQLKNGNLAHLQNTIDEPVRPRSSTDPFFDRQPQQRRVDNTQVKDRVVVDDFAAHFATARTDGSRPRASGGQTRSTRRKGSSSSGSRNEKPRGAFRDASRPPRGARPRDSERDARIDSVRRDDRGPAKGLSRQIRDELRESSSSFNSRDENQRRPFRESKPTEADAGSEARISRPEPRERRGGLMPMNIKYTTAASQFLYGKSVVKSALEQGRRKLYHLYIYGGENRADSKDNTTISRLAARHGVPVTIVPREDQRLMDKMSHGRPHNGFILETSPLPQLPIASLGELEERPGRLGFHVQLGHQTKEQQTVNGTDTFITRSSNIAVKPFVLLLNEILDPGNLGAILRTASYLGVNGVAITDRNSSSLTPVVLKSAAGAVEEIPVFTVSSPAKFIEQSKKAGWKTYAAVAPPDRKLVRKHGSKFISTMDIERHSPLEADPCILVLGNEGHGLPKEVKMLADYELSVPRFVQESNVESLNVSVAAGLLCHAFVRDAVSIPVVKVAAAKEDVTEILATAAVDAHAEPEVKEEDGTETETETETDTKDEEGTMY